MIPAKAQKLHDDWEDEPWDGFDQAAVQKVPATIAQAGIFNGTRVPPLPGIEDPVAHLLSLQQVTLREDDLIVAAYPESGGEYLVDLLPWLIQPSDASNPGMDPTVKPIELTDLTEIECRASPRIFLTHLAVAHFPTDIINKGIKIIHVIRNPKDVAASAYRQLQEKNASFSFQQFLELYLNNQIGCGHQFAYIRQLYEFRQCYPNHPVLEIHFEDIAKRPVEVMQALGHFLHVPVSGSLLDHVLASNTLLQTLGQAHGPEQSNSWSKEPKTGAIGDWKYVFTMTTNETFDFFIFQSNSTSKINFRYN